ncbi:ArsR/SmtB family transcription factor [Streptomyces chartreusis]|uniref:ArsR/SmtB family transcription factor n=1 Tax=Streptomyces chartreusis TaxID=1969 RepID=UPI00367434F3
MSVVLSLAGASPSCVSAGASPLAELGAALHAYTEAEHHPRALRWVRGLDTDAPSDTATGGGAPTSTLTPVLRQRIRDWAPLWASYRARYLFPLSASGDRPLEAELTDVAELPLPLFVELTGYAIRGGNSGASLDRILNDRAQREGLLTAAEQRSTARAELARRLLDSPEALRADLLDLLAQAARALEPDLARAARMIGGQMTALRDSLEHNGPGSTLADLDSTATYRDGPPRVVFDKFHHGIVNVATTPVLVIPSAFGRPHLLVKHEPGLAAIVHYPLVPQGEDQPGYTVVHRRLEVLRDPGRQRIARAIAREPLTPSALADRSGMTLPQVSRHLARLREAGLVTVERDGRRAYYQLHLDRVRSIGEDLLTALFH